MSSRTAPSTADADAAFLRKLYAQQVDPIEALGLFATRHQGKKAAVSFRTDSVVVGPLHFPPPSQVPPLMSALLLTVRRLVDECKKPGDEILVATFAFWGICAVHPFTDGNGRVARDFLQYLLMIRFRRPEPVLHRVEDAARELEPVLRHLGPSNLGTPKEALDQVRVLLTVMKKMTVAKLRKDEHFKVMGKWFVERLVGE